MIVKIKKIYDDVKKPTKAHEDDACFDIYAYCKKSVMVPPHRTVKIESGFATEIPTGYCALVYARSGMATKAGLRPANCVAVIDAGYRGEWMLPIHNDTDKPKYVNNGDRIAQFMIAPVLDTYLAEVEELEDSERGDGGFGSSGV